MGGSLNTFRMILVGTAVVAALVAAAFRMWLVAGVLAVAVVLHGIMWLFLPRIYGETGEEEEREEPAGPAV